MAITIGRLRIGSLAGNLGGSWNITPPTPTVTINSNTSLTVDWVITGLDKTVTAVELWHSTDGTTYTRLVKLGAVATYDHTGLENNSIHYYKVRYWSGLYVSGFSGVVSASTFNALFQLDGTIITVEEAKYFVDVVNGKNFLITGYDFADDWTRGFPYKSAATISAPAGDATLIAADINNFLYDSGGDPNQIPVVSLFQDIDYEHKLFCKHVAQVVDENDVETSEPYVSEVVLYDTVKSGADLTTCQAYFGVPEEDATAYWVMPTGNDTTGDGSKESPWATVTKAITVVNDGKTINSKSIIDGYWYILTKDLSIKGLGRLFNNSNNATAIYVRTSTLGTIDRLYHVPTVGTAYGIRMRDSANGIIQNSYIQSTAPLKVAGQFKQATNVIFKGDSGVNSFSIQINAGTQALLVDTCHFAGQSTFHVYNFNGGGKITVKNSKFTGAGTDSLKHLNASAGFESYGNKYLMPSIRSIAASDGDFGSMEIHHEYIEVTASVNPIIDFRNNVTNLHRADNNTIIALADNDQIFIKGENAYMQANNNILKQEAAEVASNAEILNVITTTGVTSFKANNNKVLSKRTGGYNIGIGSEGTNLGDDSINTIEIQKNYIKGRHAYADASTNTVHAIFVGFQINAQVKYNFAWGSGYATVLKHSGGTYASGGVYYNIYKDFVRGLLCKGINGVNIVNNTFFSDDITPQYTIQLDENTGSDASSDCVIKNNIFIYLGSDTYNPIEILNGGTGNVADYNLYYCPNGTLTFINTNGERTWAQWRSDGFDANSSILTDEQFLGLFTDYSNNDFSLPAGSAAIGAGETLDAAYDDGLDASTDWGDDNIIPVIVTKQQNVAWDCGAYVH